MHGSELTLLEKGRAVHLSTRSGWGHLQTCPARDGMSASPLKADVRAAASMSAKGHKPTLAKMPSRVANGGDQNVREDVAIAS